MPVSLSNRPSANGLAVACVIFASALLFLIRLGDHAVTSDEARWAEVAREMQSTGDLLHPTINGVTSYDKPVGSYWLIGLASHFTGEVNETAARLPAALSALLGVLLVILIGRHLFDPSTGVVAGALLATSFSYAFYARRTTADEETVVGVLATVQGRTGQPFVAQHLGPVLERLVRGQHQT